MTSEATGENPTKSQEQDEKFFDEMFDCLATGAARYGGRRPSPASEE
jgi:hypothetical protein